MFQNKFEIKIFENDGDILGARPWKNVLRGNVTRCETKCNSYRTYL